MCGSSGGNTSPPPSPPPTRFNYNVADTSNTDAQKQAASMGTTSTPKSFGSELGSSSPATTGAGAGS